MINRIRLNTSNLFSVSALAIVVVISFLGTEAGAAGAGFLSAGGAAHSHSNGASVFSRSVAVAASPPAVGLFAGTDNSAASVCGTAFAAGSGTAAVGGGGVALLARARVALVVPAFPPPHCILHAWAIGHADPTPDPNLDISSDSELTAIFGEIDPVTDVASLSLATFNADLAANPIGSSVPGADADVDVNLFFNDPLDRIEVTFNPASILTVEGNGTLLSWSAGVGLTGDFADNSLDFSRSVTFDESGSSGAGGWLPTDVTETDIGAQKTISDLDGLDFNIAVSPGFTQTDFDDGSFVLQDPVTASGVNTVVPALNIWGITTLCALLAGSAVFLAVRQRRSSVAA